VYLKQLAKVENKAVATDALKKSFIIKFVDKGGDSTGGGSTIQSSELAKDVTALKLAQLRPYVNMSSDSSRHEFCFSDGTGVSESMLLKTYISKGELPTDIDSELPILFVYFQKIRVNGRWAEPSDDMKARGTVETKTNLDFGPGVEKPITIDEMKQKVLDISKYEMSKDLLGSLSSIRAGQHLTPAELDELQWDVILRNCNVMYGWKFDLNTMSVKRAPCQAFKLRNHLNISYGPAEENRTIVTTTITTTKTTKTTGTTTSVTPPVVEKSTETIAAGSDYPGDMNLEESGENPEEPTDPVEPEDPDALPPKTSNALPKNPRPKPNAIPSFAVTDEANVTISVITSNLEESMAKNNFTATSFELGGSANFKGVNMGGSGGTSSRNESSQGTSDTTMEKLMVGNYRFPRATVFLRAEDLEPTEELRAAIEQVRVTKSLDRLKGLYDSFGHFFCEEVILGGRLQTTRSTNITDKMSMTSAKTQFKAEVGLAVSMPVAGGFNSKVSRGTGTDVAHHVQETNARDAIAFEATGGNTILVTNPPQWCLSVLDYQNWRVIERAGLTPIAQIIGKCHDMEMRNVRMWFTQAVPVLSKFVAIPESRVISIRLKLDSKVPQMNKMEQSDGSERNLCHYLGHQYGKYIRPIRIGLEMVTEVSDELIKLAEAELKKKPSAANPTLLSPVALMIAGARMLTEGVVTSDITIIYKEVHEIEEIALFSPARTQAPTILQYEDSNQKAGITKEEHGETVWNMVVPHGDWLQDNSLVMLTSGSASQHNDDVWLTVYRNSQGHFMPAMTSSGDASFWRVNKDTSATGASHGPEISEGNAIQLSWRFSDQTAGFRDFFNDTFGRRTFNRPEGVEDELFLKLPFPGFQKTTAKDRAGNESSGLPMIMSQINTKDAFVQELMINSKVGESRLKRTYNLHDTTFRIDLVGNDGFGELNDYMTLGLNQSVTETFKTILSERSKTFQAQRGNVDSPEARIMDKVNQVGIALLGPAFPLISAPARTIVSKAMGFFKGIFG
jgi:hypothetical protein